MLKIIGSLLILTGSGGIGYCKATSYKKRYRELCIIKEMLIFIKTQLGFKNLLFKELIDILSAEFTTLEFLKQAKGNMRLMPPPVAIINSIDSSTSYLTSEELNWLKQLFKSIGTVKLTDQLDIIEMNIELFSARADIAKSEEERYAKPCRNSGILLGLFVITVLF